MNASILRQLWSLIEKTHANTLLKLSDRDLVEQLLRQLEDRKPLSNEENRFVSAYIESKILLIRDLAEARSA